MKKSVNVYLPFRFPFSKIFGEEVRERAAGRVEELLSSLENVGRLEKYSIDQIKPLHGDLPAQALSWVFRQSPDLPIDFFDVRAFTAVVDFQDAMATLRVEGRLQDPKYLDLAALFRVGSLVEDVLDLSELAIPGSICVAPGICIGEGGVVATREIGGFSSLLATQDFEPKWPELQELGLLEVLEWADLVGFKKEIMPVSKVGRCLAAFSHMTALAQINAGECLFRAVQGLEAFYCDGVGDLRRQLDEKLGLWLGRGEGKKLRISKLYEIRSRFVHGASYIGYKDSRIDWDPKDEKQIGELEFYSTYAVRLLVATLQRCVSEGVLEVEWPFQVKTKNI